MDLINFIKNNPNDWEKLLSNPPYSLIIKREKIDDTEFIIFKYDQFKSKFSNEITKQSRGIILENGVVPVCVPFDKFNSKFSKYSINSKKASNDKVIISEKIDGSIIKLWFSITLNKWIVSTNGTIFAEKTKKLTKTGKTFYELFIETISKKYNFDISNITNLDKNYTYMFELITPDNKIIVEYLESDVFYIGLRHNKTFRELSIKGPNIGIDDYIINLGINKPKMEVYDFKTNVEKFELFMNKYIDIVNNLKYKYEGYVITHITPDKFIRYKLKSYIYLNSKDFSNDILDDKNILLSKITENYDCYIKKFNEEAIKRGDILCEKYDKLVNKINECLKYLDETYSINPSNYNKKLHHHIIKPYVTKNKLNEIIFPFLNKNNDKTIDEYLSCNKITKIINMIQKIF